MSCNIINDGCILLWAKFFFQFFSVSYVSLHRVHLPSFLCSNNTMSLLSDVVNYYWQDRNEEKRTKKGISILKKLRHRIIQHSSYQLYGLSYCLQLYLNLYAKTDMANAKLYKVTNFFFSPTLSMLPSHYVHIQSQRNLECLVQIYLLEIDGMVF